MSHTGKERQSLLSLLVALAMISSCSFRRDNPFDPESPRALRANGTITGTILLESGGTPQPVIIFAGSAAVGDDVAEQQATADTEGRFTLSLPDGTFNIRGTSQGYRTVYLNPVSVDPGEALTLGTITLLLARGILEGRVVVEGEAGEDPKPAAGAEIAVTSVSASEAQTVRADIDGEFRVDSLPEGEYSVRAALKGYAPSYTAGAVVVAASVVTPIDEMSMYPASAVVTLSAGGVDNAEFTNSRSIDVKLLAFVKHITEMRLSLDRTFQDAAAGDLDYSQFAFIVPFQLKDLDGLQTVYAQFKDSNGEETDVFQGRITLDRAAPVITALGINSGATFLTDDVADISADGDDPLSGIRGYRLAEDGVLDDEPEVVSFSVGSKVHIEEVVLFEGADGTRTVAFAWIDRAGNESKPQTTTIEKDLTDPALVSFEASPALTKSQSITLTIDATDAAQMLVSNTADFLGAAWQAFVPSLIWTVPPGDGAKTVYLRLRDAALNTTDSVDSTITLDQTDPSSVSFLINGGSPITNSYAVTLSASATDTNGPLTFMAATDSGFTVGAWEYTTYPAGAYQPIAVVDIDKPPTWHLPGADGLKFAYARICDAAGNCTDTSTFITLDTTGPTQGNVSVVEGTHTNTTLKVNLDILADDADIMRITGDVTGNNADVDLPYGDSLEVDLDVIVCPTDPPNNCTININVTFRDTVGNSSTATTSIVWDTVDPDPPNSIDIEGTIRNGVTDQGLTGTTSVTLLIDSTETAGMEMLISNAADYFGATWEDYAASRPWTLATGDSDDKRVYVRLRDATGNESTAAVPTDEHGSIRLDETPPSAPTIVVENGDGATNKDVVDIDLTIDNGTDPDTQVEMRLSTGTFPAWSSAVQFNTQTTIDVTAGGDGPKTVFAQFRDLAGNVTLPINDGIRYDKTPPAAPTVSINNDAIATNNTTVSVSVSKTAADVVDMRVSTDGTMDAETWTNFSLTTVATLEPATDCAAGDADCRIVLVQLRDDAGNPSEIPTVAVGSDGITLDTQDPTADIVPPSGSTIGPKYKLVVTFNEPVVAGTIALTRALAGESDGGVLEPTGRVELRISPDPAGSKEWGGGNNRQIRIDAEDDAGNSMTQLQATYNVDNVEPTATQAPAEFARVTADATLVIEFSESINIGTFPALGGTLGTDADGLAWSETNALNDTLTLTASSGWTPGPAQTITVLADDLYGNSSGVLTFTWFVDNTPPVGTPNPLPAITLIRDTTIVLDFTEEMDPASLVVTGALRSEADWVWSDVGPFTNNRLTFTPKTAWPDGLNQDLIIDATDVAGNPLTPPAMSYTIDGIEPAIDTLAPPDGDPITISEPIVITFSEIMDKATLALTGDLASTIQDWAPIADPVTLTLTPAPVVPGTWPLGVDRTLTVNITDRAGNPLPTANLTFTVDNDPPGIDSSSPVAGARINATQSVTVTFDEPMDQGSIVIDTGGSSTIGVPTVWNWNSSTEVVFDAPTAWAAGVSMDLVFGATDAAGNTTTGLSVSWHVDNVAPVGTPNPLDSVTLNKLSVIVLDFNESMDPLSLSVSGNMSPEAKWVWSDVAAFTNNRLTFTPNPQWTGGASRALVINADDLVGNALTPPSMTYTVDATDPFTTDIDPADGDRITTTEGIQITFSEPVNQGTLVTTGDLGATIKTWDGGNPRVVTLTPAGGTWPVLAPATLELNIEDVPGNPLATTLSLTYSIDGAAPLLSASSPADGGKLKSNTEVVLTFNETINAGSLQVDGSVTDPLGAPATVTWSVNDTVATLAAPGGGWNKAPALRLLELSVADIAGNGATFQVNLTVDDDPPVLQTQAPSNTGEMLASQTITADFDEEIDPGAIVVADPSAPAVSLGTPANVQRNGSTQVELTAPGGGWTEGAPVSLLLTVADPLGNSKTYTLTYDVDDTPPVGVESPPDGNPILPTAPIIVVFDDEMDPAVASLTLGGTLGAQAVSAWSQTGAFANDTLTLSPPAVPGTWQTTLPNETLTIDAKDVPGNPLAATLSLTYSIDGAAPLLSASSPADGGKLKSNTDVVLTFNETINTGSLQVNGSVTDPLGAPATVTWSVNDTVATLAAPGGGWNNAPAGRLFEFTVKDVAGNSATFQRNFTIDDVAPVLQVQTPANNTFMLRNVTITAQFDEDVVLGAPALTNNTIGTPSTTQLGASTTVELTAPAAPGWNEGEPVSVDLTVADTAGNSVTVTLTYNVDGTAPQIQTQTPANGATLGLQNPLVIDFNEPMTPTATPVSASTLGDPAAMSFAWSNGNHMLTIDPPVANWNVGDNLTVTLDVVDRVGLALASATLTHHVLGGGVSAVVYVTQNGDGSRSGSLAAPMDDLAAAMAAAAAMVPAPAQVSVAEGTYNVDSSAALGTQITLYSGIALVGGYDATFATQNPTTYPSYVVDDSEDAATEADPNRVIECPATATATDTFVVDGFDLEAASGAYSAAVVCDGAGTLTLSNSRIAGGTTDSGRSYGVVSRGDLVAYNNVVFAGDQSTDNVTRAFGFLIEGGNATLRNNTVFVEARDNARRSYAIYLDVNSDLIAENNILYGRGSGTERVVYQRTDSGSAATISAFHNNNVIGGVLYRTYNGSSGTDYKRIDLMESAMGAVATGNIMLGYDGDDPANYRTKNGPGDKDPTMFVGSATIDKGAVFSSDWHLLDADAEVEIRRGGLDGANEAPLWSFTDDRDGTLRTNPVPAAPNDPSNANAAGWSIGAYENDS